MSQANHAHKLSALDEIDATLQPIGPQPCLRAEVDRLVKSNNVRALVALFDAYVASAMAFQSILNRPIARDVEILEKESAHAWSKAFYVATVLRPFALISTISSNTRPRFSIAQSRWVTTSKRRSRS